MGTLQFETIGDIKRFKTNLQTLKIQQRQFQIVTLHKIATNLVLNRIHQKMKSAGFSQKIITNTIISGIEIRSKNKARIHFKSELFSDTGYDIALGREEGTKRHFIKPQNVKALHGKSEFPFFSKGHWVDGIVSLYIIKNTLKEMASPFQDSYNRALNEWYAENLGERFNAS